MPGPLHFKSGDQGKGSPRDFFPLLRLSFLFFFFFYFFKKRHQQLQGPGEPNAL